MYIWLYFISGQFFIWIYQELIYHGQYMKLTSGPYNFVDIKLAIYAIYIIRVMLFPHIPFQVHSSNCLIINCYSQLCPPVLIPPL